MSLDYLETGTFAQQRSRAQVPGRLRVVTWNIDRGCCFDQIVVSLAQLNADLILLQECDLNAKRSGYRNVARDLAQELKMSYAFGVEFVELSQGDSALHGQATLSRTQLSNTRVLRFQQQSKFWKPRWFLPNLPPLQRRLGGRIALVSETRIDQTLLAVYNLHLESRRGDDLRFRQMRELLREAEGYGSEIPVVLAGDFNCDLTQPTFSEAIHVGEFMNPFAGEALRVTIRERKSRGSRAIDWVLHRGMVSSESPVVHTSVSGSDHFPLSLTLQLP